MLKWFAILVLGFWAAVIGSGLIQEVMVHTYSVTLGETGKTILPLALMLVLFVLANRLETGERK